MLWAIIAGSSSSTRKGEIEMIIGNKLGAIDEVPGEGMVTEPAVNPWLDWTARAAIVIVFTALTFISLAQRFLSSCFAGSANPSASWRRRGGWSPRARIGW